MSTTTKDRRRENRHEVQQSLDAYVEFDHPNGERQRVPLLDMSVAGLSFWLPAWLAEVESGTRFSDVEVHVGEGSIRGELLVLRVEPDSEPDAGVTCGAYFYPDTAAELDKMTCLISGLKAAQSDESS